MSTLGLEILHGRDFSREMLSDREGFLVNEEVLRELGLDPESAVGSTITQVAGNEDDSDRTGEIIGVFADAHFESIHQSIRPLVIGMQEWWRYIPVRLSVNQTAEPIV